MLLRWKQAYPANAHTAFPGNGRLASEQEELCQLRDKVKRLRMERDILKLCCRVCASLVGGETLACGLSSLLWEERPAAYWWQ